MKKSSDLEIIKQLEKELGVTLKRVEMGEEITLPGTIFHLLVNSKIFQVESWKTSSKKNFRHLKMTTIFFLRVTSCHFVAKIFWLRPQATL